MDTFCAIRYQNVSINIYLLLYKYNLSIKSVFHQIITVNQSDKYPYQEYPY